MNIKEDIRILSDEELIYKIVKTNDSVFFAELYDRYASKVYNKCLRFAASKEEAQDLTHDLFLKLFVKLCTYKGKSKFSTWLHSFNYNFCINHVTRNKQIKGRKLFERTFVQFEDEELVRREAELFELKCEKLDLAMSRLEPKHKAILLMKYQDDFSIKDIQKVLEISGSAVKMRLKRARGRILMIYEDLY